MTGAVLRATGVEVQRGTRTVIAACDIELSAGEVVGLYGPNGAGKSSLLEALAGLLPISAGRVEFQGRVLGRDLSLLEYRRRMAAVFQEPLLLHGSVLQNVTLGLKLRGLRGNAHAARVRPWLERLGIAHVADRAAHSLSGGEAQRTSLARALVLEPELLFLDEPFASLDAPTRSRLAFELADILAERRMATLFVTHDLMEVFALCHRCIVLDQGRVLQEGNPAGIVHRPQSWRVAEITGAANLFRATVTGKVGASTELDWNGQRVLSPACLHPEGACIGFLIRQDDIHLGACAPTPSNRVEATVERIREERRGFLISARAWHGAPITFGISSPANVAPGDKVVLAFDPEAVWVVPETSPEVNRSGRGARH